ncbi:hypothetical protein [Halomarina ordinaria]|uniref:Uncharacterized protein n=1 Tax=Halomarina ordinaria TaxID=3033939 RepID=A0ABD5U776_9EURY|nr:hypothetical protein [Halomarina sp. PSRA2]
MDSLAPDHVPLYETPAEQRRVWERCAERGLPVVAVRDAARGYVVRYDLQHLERELRPEVVQRLRDRVHAFRRQEARTDADSQVERVGGEVGPVSGDLHTATETDARDLASHLAATVFDRSNWAHERR